MAPIGLYPDVIPFAHVIRSGTNPNFSHANVVPWRPNPVITSSDTSSTSWRSQISRTRAKYDGGAVKQPPEFCTGSITTAATVDAPSNRIASSMRSAAQRPNASGSSRCTAARKMFVFGARCPPGVNGSKSCFIAGNPVIDNAPCVVPWYADIRLITLCFAGLPCSLKYCFATFHAVSTASPPPVVKKTRLRSPGVRSARRSASWIADGCAYPHTGKNANVSACRAATSASSRRPCPTCTTNSPDRPSRMRRPRSS